MSSEKIFQIAYMPYAPIEESFTLGEYEVWDYYKENTKRINNKLIVQRLNGLLGRYFEWIYKENNGIDQPLQKIYIISPKGFNFANDILTEKQKGDIKSINHIIAFCAVNEPYFDSSASDPFILYFANLSIGPEDIALYDKMFTKVEMIKFMKPYHLVNGILEFRPTELCKALGDSIELRNKPSINRILRTLELFYHTVTFSEMMTNEHRLLSLVMCFEYMLEFSEKGKRWYKCNFMNKLERKLNNHWNIKETREVKCNNRTKPIKKPLGCWWAYDLYELRNNIIHGNEIDWQKEKYGNIWTRITFGGILLKKLIKKMLIEENIWKMTQEETMIQDIMEADSLDNILLKLVKEYNNNKNKF